jgi:hypothetical protein
MQQLQDWAGQAAKIWDEYRGLPDRFGREYDEVFGKLVYTETVESWEAFLRWSRALRGWGFRGQRGAAWPLQTSLERAARVEYSYAGNCGHSHLDRGEETRELLRRFRDQAWLYIPSPLLPGDDLASWLALMQHCGVPTRLLDWTDSARAALYFALEESTCILSGTPLLNEPAAVWAIDLAWLETRGSEIFASAKQTPPRNDNHSRITHLNAILGQGEVPLIVRIDPFRGNPRMVAQRADPMVRSNSNHNDRASSHPEMACCP